MFQKKRGAFMQQTIRPERILAAGFLALIVLGTLLLMLPAASTTGQSMGLMDSLFTATSAVCVTGLVAVDTGTALTLFGQLMLLALIQLGGLGFMIFATLMMVALGRRISLRSRMLIRESMNTATLSGLVRLTRYYGLIALTIELSGAMLLAIRFVPRFGPGRGLYFALFHAVSAFCNAGFDLFGHFSSLTAFRDDPLVLLTVSALIILGGLGFSVILETLNRRFRWRTLSLHAKLVLLMTGSLLMLGTVFYALVEWRNPQTLAADGAGGGSRLLNAFFQSVTMRTAGFNSVDLSKLTEASKLFSVCLMFVGASPASTGGGVKTTTISVLALIVLSVARGQNDVSVLGRRLPSGLLRRALSILFITLVILLAGTMVLTLVERNRMPFIDLLFESASAIATVGVSAVGTPNLSLVSRITLIPMMFFGRVGPLTMALALANKQSATQNHLRYPEENIVIG